MSEEHSRSRRIAEQVVTPASAGVESVQGTVLPSILWRGIRKALDGGHGRLRMEPQELANMLGAAIDLEVERLAREREEYGRHKRLERMLNAPKLFFGERLARERKYEPSQLDHKE